MNDEYFYDKFKWTFGGEWVVCIYVMWDGRVYNKYSKFVLKYMIV